MSNRDYTKPTMSLSLLIRIFSRITVRQLTYTTPCWLWYPERWHRYGFLWIDKEPYLAHRLIYCLFVEQVPPTLFCDHLCRTPSCVNPAHIEPVTPRENLIRGIGFPAYNAKKTHCKRGHEFTEDNTYIHQGRRACKQCKDVVAEQMRRKKGMKIKREGFCFRGHKLTSENVYTPPNQPNRQVCKACDLLLKRQKGQPKRHYNTTHCAKGHELTPENTYIMPKSGHKKCRTCRKIFAKEYYDRNKRL